MDTIDINDRLDRYDSKSLITKIRYFVEDRLHALKSLSISSQDIIDYGTISLNRATEELTVNDQSANLPLKQNPAKFIVLLLEHPSKLFTYKEIAREIDLNGYDESKGNDHHQIIVLKMKGELIRLLKRGGMSEGNRKYLTKHILASTNNGYKFVPPVIQG